MSHLLLREDKPRPGLGPTRLLASCALAAIAAVSLYPQAASAQAFQGAITNAGSISVDRQITGANSETLTVSDNSVIINWSASSTGTNPFTFLPAGNTATFEAGDISGGYLVINRIFGQDGNNPRMDFFGTVNSDPVGRIWFYSPGGILVGPGAEFNVGSLLLTANDPVEILDEFGYGTGSYRFTAQNPTAAVVNQGTINAQGQNAYVAMIAPRVRQAGVVTVAGSAAYIAAEIADLTINGTLFDINVSLGSDADGTGQTTLEHQGTTTTELELGYGSLPRQVVMVAVPKNDAVTMLVGGTLGYAQASEAVNSGGHIILSAGYNVAGTEITSRAGDAQATADIAIGTGNFNAVTEGRATGGAIMQATTGTSINFASRLSLSGLVRAQIIATDGDINIGGDLLLSSDDLETGDAGEALLEATAGNTITIAGSATVSADAGWSFNDATEIGRNAVGGSASVIVGAGGSISVGGDLDVTATAQGEFGAEGGGNGQGGTATVSLTGGTLDVQGDLLVDTTGIGGQENAGSLGNGGGTGGTSLVELLDGATLTLDNDGPQDLEVFANGGTDANNPDSSPRGPGQGGTASVIVRNSTVNLNSIDVKATGEGGNGPDPQEEGPAAAGYDGTGGTASVELASAVGAINLVEIDADGSGGNGGFGTTGGAGGTGRGGSATLLVTGNAPVITEIELEADGTGGEGGGAFQGLDVPPGNGGAGGAGFGGTALVEASAGGTLDITLYTIDVTGRGGFGGSGSDGTSSGSGGDGGSGTGGTLELRADGGTINISTDGSFTLAAQGFGGFGGFAGIDDGGTQGVRGNGGDGTGGTVLLNALNSGLISATNFATLDATGTGGYSFESSGDGTGGSALIQVSGGGQIDLLGGADLYAYGDGGSDFFQICDILVCPPQPTQDAGDGFGGVASISSLDGTGVVNIDGVYLDANGYGGRAFQGLPGSGLGGDAIIEVGANASFDFGSSAEINAAGYGGGGAATGTGGTARVSVAGGDLVTDDLFINASGFGSFFESSTGTGTGGSASLLITNAGTLDVTFGTVVVADGNTGTIFENGGAIGPIPPGCPCVAPPPLFDFGGGGDGVGGTVIVSVDGTLTTPDLIASAKGVGGAAFIAGEPGFDGEGGDATVEFLSGDSQVDALTIDARGGGGEGGAGAPGGTGGSGTGGTATLRVAGGAPLLGDLAVLAGGFAGPGGQGLNIQGTPFAGGAGGTGIGGTAVVEAGLGGTLTLETFTFDARGQGGAGGAGGDSVQSGADGGDGGDGTGGTVEVRTAGGTIIVTDPDGLQLTAYGLGGVGGGGGDTIDGSGPDGSGGDGGDGTGGNAVVNVLGGSITSPDTFVDSSGFGGDGGSAGTGAGGGAAGTGGVAAGGSSRISVADGNGVSGGASLGFVSMDSSGFNADSSAGTAGRLIIEDIGTIAGGLVMDGLFASSFGAASLSGPAFQFTSTDGTVDVAGDVDIFTDGDVVFSAAGSGGLNATGDVGIFTDGSVRFDHLTPALGAATLSGASVFIDALGSVVGSTGSLIRSTVGNIQIVAPTIDLATAEAAANLFLTAGGANTIVIDVAIAGEDIVLNSAGDITVGTAEAGDDFIAFAAGAFTATSVTTTGLGPDSELDGSNIDVAATEDLRLDQGDAADAIFLVSRQGSVLGAGLLQAGTLIELDAAVDVAINDSQSGTSTFLTAGNDITANSLVAGADIVGTAGNDIIIASLVAGVTGPFSTGTFVVDALANSAAGGSGLPTFTVEAGQTIGVSSSTDDLWSAGALPRFSDGDGLIVTRFATATDDSGQPIGTQIGANFGPLSQSGLSAPFGALVGEVGGTYFLLGANGTVSAPASGTLNLVYWDANAGDNTGNIRFGLTAGTPPATGQGFITLSAGGDAVVGSAIAGGTIDVSAASIDLANATAGIDVVLSAAGGIAVGTSQVGDDFRASAGTIFAAEQVVTTGLGPDDDNDGSPDGSNIIVASSGDLRLDIGTAVDTVDLASSAGSVLSDGTLTADALLVDAALDIALNDVFVTQDLNLNAAGGGISGNSFNSDGSITLVAFDPITLASGADAGTFIELITTGPASDVSAGALVANDDIRVDASGAITLVSAASANGEIDLSADGAVVAGALSSGASTVIESGTSITVTSVAANLLGLVSDEIQGFSATSIGDIVVGTVVAENIGLGTFGSITAGSLTADNLVGLFADGDVSLGNVTAGGLLYVGNPSTAISQNIFDGGLSEAQVEAALLAADPVPTGGDVTSTGLINVGRAVILAGGDIVLNGIMTLEDLNLVSSGLLSTGNVESIGGMVDLVAAGDMTLGNVRAAGSIFLTGGGLITALDLTAGTGPLLGGGTSGGGGSGSTTAGIAPGFDDFVFPRNDDGATDAITLPFLVNFFGTEYGQTFVSNNGYITFNFGQGTFTPSGLGADYSGQPIIAPFFADVDTSNPASAELTYGTGSFAGRQAFGATWDGVGYYPSAADKLNNFQVILVDRSDTGPGNFDIYYNYTRITWETGGASGGIDGFGGISAAVGYNAGTGNQPGTFFELAGSRVPGSFLDNGTMPLILGTNNGVPGQLQFQVRGGQVIMGMGDISVTNLAPGNTGNVTLGNLSASNIDIQSANDLTIASAAASTGEVDLFAVGTVQAGSLSSGTSTGIESLTGDVIVDSVTANLIATPAGVIQGFGAIALNGNVTVGSASADNIGLAALGDVTAGSLVSDDLVIILAGGDTVLDTVSAGGLFYIGNPQTLESLGGFADFDVDVFLAEFDPVELAALPFIPSGGDITIGQAQAGLATLSAGGTLGFGTIASASDALLLGESGVAGDRVTAAGDVTLGSPGGPVVVTTDLASGGVVDAAGTSVTLNALGNLNLAQVLASTGDVLVNAAGTLGIIGNVLGTQIFLESADIAVGSAAQIGTTARTTLIDILANASSLFLGGTGGAGFSLDNAEFARFAARDISIAGGAVTIGTLDVRGAGASSPNVLETLSIASSGGIDVVGALAFGNATSANVLSLSAAGEVFVDTAGGSIALTNGTALAGTLSIEGESITVASQAAAAEAEAATSTDARDRRLARNDGPVNEGGYLQAADIVLAAADHIWVQNSGASILTNDRRGVTAGPSTIRLIATGSGPVEIILNGRQQDGAGGFITGRDLIPEVIIEGEASPAFTDRSTINGCLIASPVCVSGGGPDLPTIQDFIDEVFGDGNEDNPQGSITRPPLLRLSSLIDVAGFTFAPVVDDPVTGAGNEDLWLDPASVPQGETVDEAVTGSGRELDCEGEDEDDPRCVEQRRNQEQPAQ